MSVEIMSMVFKRYPSGGGERLLALALSDHASDDGTRVFPSVALLAFKTVQSERTVQRQMRKMEDIGWLIQVSDGIGGKGNATEYCINPDWIKGDSLPSKGDNLSPFDGSPKGDIQNPKGDIAVSPKGDIAMSPESSLTIREPSYARAITREAINSAKPKPAAKPKPDLIVWHATEKIFKGISENQMRSWEEAFPKLDIDGELTRIELWYENNPKKRKRTLQRFIGNWLARAFKDFQERAKPKLIVKQPQPGRSA